MANPEEKVPRALCITCGAPADYYIECAEIRLTLTTSTGTYCASHAVGRLDTLQENIRRWERTKQEKGFTQNQINDIQRRLAELKAMHPGIDEKERHAESVVVVLNSGTDKKKTIEMGVEKGDHGNKGTEASP